MGFAEQRSADVILFEVERNAVNAMGKLKQLTGGDFVESVHAGDTVAGRKHRADFLDLNRFFVIANLLFDDSADLRRADFHIDAP